MNTELHVIPPDYRGTPSKLVVKAHKKIFNSLDLIFLTELYPVEVAKVALKLTKVMVNRNYSLASQLSRDLSVPGYYHWASSPVAVK